MICLSFIYMLKFLNHEKFDLKFDFFVVLDPQEGSRKFYASKQQWTGCLWFKEQIQNNCYLNLLNMRTWDYWMVYLPHTRLLNY